VTVSDEPAGVFDADAANRAAAPTAVAVLHHIVSSIVDDPAAVRVETDDDGRRVRLDVHVGPGDLGRVIGRRGRTAQSIRTVVRAAAARDHADVDIEFVDD
jgi:predicted RNA-binding protein YlqC (UPF0109 family)